VRAALISPLVPKLHILHLSVGTASCHQSWWYCATFVILRTSSCIYPSYLMLLHVPVRCVAGRVLAVISNTNTSGRGPWRPVVGVVGAGWVIHRCRRCRNSCGAGTVGAAHCVPNAESHQLLCRLAARHCRSPPAALGKSLRLVRCQGGKARSHSGLSYSP
jgi:hypothetical protein